MINKETALERRARELKKQELEGKLKAIQERRQRQTEAQLEAEVLQELEKEMEDAELKEAEGLAQKKEKMKQTIRQRILGGAAMARAAYGDGMFPATVITGSESLGQVSEHTRTLVTMLFLSGMHFVDYYHTRKSLATASHTLPSACTHTPPR